jgi:hypothetical protein
MFKKRLALTALEIECQVRSGFRAGFEYVPSLAGNQRSIGRTPGAGSTYFLLGDESALIATPVEWQCA